MNDKPTVALLMGPTASGKTELAIRLCEQSNFEIISVDSAMVYRGMDIGSAKPSHEELSRAPHRLIDIRDPREAYSAAEFRRDALREISEIHQNGNIPLLVGGTMLYFKVLLEGVAQMPATEPSIRADVEAMARLHGWPHVHQLLSKVDPVAAERIHPNHSQRISRAYEVYIQTGKTMTQWHNEQPQEWLSDEFNVRQMAIMPSDRGVLHQRIERRFDQMIELGFQAEVERLRKLDGLRKDDTSMRAVGYQQMWNYLDELCTFDDMLEQAKAATRQLAKRQFTWLRSWSDVEALNVSETPDWEALLSEALDYYLR